MMHWVIQTDIYGEEGFEPLLTAIDRLGLPRTLVKVIPFDGGLEVVEGVLPGPVYSGDTGSDAIVMGSYTLSRRSRKLGWRPGAFLDNLDFVTQRERWGERMLNHDALITPFGEVPESVEPFFIRPTEDTKAFTGFVCDWPYYQDWRAGIVRMGPEPDFGLDTSVMVCSRKEVWSETRTWIVGGRLVTCSGYKVGTIKRYSHPWDVDQRITDFAQECADIWSPNDGYVLDVADTPDGLKIVEVNNLNSAGFYRGDMNRLVQALEDWAECPSGLLW
jgi:hypothetical protein